MKNILITLMITFSSLVAHAQMWEESTEAALDNHYLSQDYAQKLADEKFTRNEVRKSQKEYMQAMKANKSLEAKLKNLTKTMNSESRQLIIERKKASKAAKTLSQSQVSFTKKTQKVAKLREKVSQLQAKRDDLVRKHEDTKVRMVVVNSEIKSLSHKTALVKKQIVAQIQRIKKDQARLKKAVAVRGKMKADLRARQAKLHIPKPSMARN